MLHVYIVSTAFARKKYILSNKVYTASIIRTGTGQGGDLPGRGPAKKVTYSYKDGDHHVVKAGTSVYQRGDSTMVPLIGGTLVSKNSSYKYSLTMVA